MTACSSIQTRFSEYLDGDLTGAEMHSIAAHLQSCENCANEFAAWRGMQGLLAGIGPAKIPADLSLRLRIAVSQERARTTGRRRMDVWQMYWQNTLGPLLARGAAGLASAMILLGALGLMIGTVAAPPTVAANEAAMESTTSPQFLYRVGDADSRVTFRHPIMVEAEISQTGRVYEYRIVSGPQSKHVQEQLDNFLLMSHFAPAVLYGAPVASRAILSFPGTADHRG